VLKRRRERYLYLRSKYVDCLAGIRKFMSIQVHVDSSESSSSRRFIRNQKESMSIDRRLSKENEAMIGGPRAAKPVQSALHVHGRLVDKANAQTSFAPF
jgi:hypothetical protein